MLEMHTHTLSHHHLQRGPTTLPQSLAPHQLRGKGRRGLSAEPALASFKSQRPLKTHSCSYLTQRLNTAQQLRSYKLLEQLNWLGPSAEG